MVAESQDMNICHIQKSVIYNDVFDTRNWSLIVFAPCYEKNKKDKAFNEYMLEMRKKIETGKEFFCDLDEDVEEELIESMKVIYEYRKEELNILSLAKKEDHIIDQWTFPWNNVPHFDERSKPIAFRVIMRAAAAECTIWL